MVPSDDVGQPIRNNVNRPESPLSTTSSISSGSITTNAAGNLKLVDTTTGKQIQKVHAVKTTKTEYIGTHPGECAFFKLLRAELNKASRFFERAKQELCIRDERMRDGIEIMKKPGSTMVGADIPMTGLPSRFVPRYEQDSPSPLAPSNSL